MSLAAPPPVATTGLVRVVGTGLLGASVGLSLATRGVDVVLHDPSRTALALARDVGAGRLPTDHDAPVVLVVVAAPPDVCAGVVLAELAAHPQAVVTDVASVKGSVLAEVAAAGGDLSRYVGSHPMAGSERSGPTAARADLFAGRPWVIADSGHASAHTLLAVRQLAVDLGATPVTMPAEEHDAAVAVVSHLPQVMASLVAARLVDAPAAALDLSGQGLRDVTRIAASDAPLWTSILAANAAAVRDVLSDVRGDLDDVIDALGRIVDATPSAPVATPSGATTPSDVTTQRASSGAADALGALGTLARAIASGNHGVAQIPGKHGGAQRRYDVVTVLVPDAPGELARLFGDVGDAGTNIEDLQLEHSPRQPVGLAMISVLTGRSERLEAELTARGWRVASRG